MRMHLVCFLTVLSCPWMWADVVLPNVFSDHMVLQRERELPVWGTASPGERVHVSLAGLGEATTEADKSGSWSVSLPAQAAGGPHVLTVQGNNRIEVKDVLIGEVWLCSGQSNMEWSVRQSANPDAEIAAAQHPRIRHLKVPHIHKMTEQSNQPGRWQVCSPQTVAHFTATGYYFGRRLQEELDVPIGLLGANWGGTRIEPWTPLEGFAKVPALASIHQDVQRRTPGSPQFQQLAGNYLKSIEAWTTKAKAQLAANQSLAPAPAFPKAIAPYKHHQSPTVLYNAMIAPLVPYAIRGAIWYQGESNHQESDYTEKTIALVEGWREVWQSELPYYYVQIAPFQYGNEDPTVLPRFWEQQAAVEARLADSGMVVIHDIGNIRDIHPKNKQDVGLRLANRALAQTYGRTDLPYAGPRFAGMKAEGAQVRIDFLHAESGLKSRDGKALTHFELIGPGSNGWKAATAELDGSTVVVQADGVEVPTALRFAWDKLAEPNLVNGAGLPAAPFRAGEEPKPPTALDSVEEAAEYELLYDLDLQKLSDSPAYSSDRSKELKGEVARVAYLLELSAGGKNQWVYASMDAFTQDLAKLALPTSKNQNTFQQEVHGLRVFSSDAAVAQAGADGKGNLEIWPNNYRQENTAKVQGAESGRYDTGDQMVQPVNGYGCLQVHANGVTLLAVNNRRAGAKADIGIGNQPTGEPDWTFSQSAQSYDAKRLRIFIKQK